MWYSSMMSSTAPHGVSSIIEQRPSQWSRVILRRVRRSGLCSPLLFYHMQGLWAREYYQYFPFVVPAVLWLVWSRWPSRVPSVPSRVYSTATAKIAVLGAGCFLGLHRLSGRRG